METFGDNPGVCFSFVKILEENNIIKPMHKTEFVS